MPETFVWKDLTVKVGEMSRRQGIACAQAYRELAAEGSIEDLMYEIEVALALYAPVKIAHLTLPITEGKRTLVMEDGTEVTLILPITREAFNDLPMTLARAWAEAAMTANWWIVEDLKNSARRVAEMKLELLSGNEQSNAPQPPPSPTTETIGLSSTPSEPSGG
jgi:hypothetical protein